jgi:hypothetical protein
MEKDRELFCRPLLDRIGSAGDWEADAVPELKEFRESSNAGVSSMF